MPDLPINVNLDINELLRPDALDELLTAANARPPEIVQFNQTRYTTTSGATTGTWTTSNLMPEPEKPKPTECAHCGRSGIRLWRKDRYFNDPPRLLCCWCAGEEECMNLRGNKSFLLTDVKVSDHIGHWVPAVVYNGTEYLRTSNLEAINYTSFQKQIDAWLAMGN